MELTCVREADEGAGDDQREREHFHRCLHLAFLLRRLWGILVLFDNVGPTTSNVSNICKKCGGTYNFIEYQGIVVVLLRLECHYCCWRRVAAGIYRRLRNKGEQ